MENKEKLQELYMKLQMIHEQIKELEKQGQLFNNQLVELNTTMEDLDDFKNLKEGTEMLIPINKGIHAKVTLKQNKDLLVNVGSNVCVQKNVEETKKLLSTQIDEIKKIQEQSILNLQQLAAQSGTIEEEIAKTSSEK